MLGAHGFGQLFPGTHLHRDRLTMLGRFLELSAHAPDILESIEFWEKLGFRQAVTNDVWRHPYAVLSDGDITIGLHQYAFDSPALTFVRPDLAQHLPTLRAAGAEFAFAKTADDEFHEAGFLTPDGQMVALLETRTFSPPVIDDDLTTLLGAFDALQLPVRRVDYTLPFLARLGLAVLAFDDDAPTTARLSDGRLQLLLDEDAKRPTLVFRSADLEGLAEAIERRLGEAPRTLRGVMELKSPEGLSIAVRST